MKIYRRILSFFASAVLVFVLLPTAGFAAQENWRAPGNSDLNILNGGIMLRDGKDFYFVQGGIFVQKGDKVKPLCAGDAKNLNLQEGFIYFTKGNEIYKIPKDGGQVLSVFKAGADIKQMYVLGSELRYISNGELYSLELNSSEAKRIGNVEGIMGFIPTQFGNILLTGEALDYTLWANDKQLLTHVNSCYTDSGYLAIQIDNQNYMAELPALFGDFDRAKSLLPFKIHGEVSLLSILDPDDENTISEYNDNNELMLDFDAILADAGMKNNVSLMSMEGEAATQETGEQQKKVIPEVTEGQKNIVKRARQLHEIEWTPLEDRYQWDYRGVFKAETTYTGLPYGQPVNSNGYVGYGVSLDTFASSVLDNTSKFYSTYSSYNKIAPVYSTDCSAYVSYAWGLGIRATTYSLPKYAEKVGDQSVYSLQIGDCLDKTSSHVVLISALTYDAAGEIIGLEVMEQTPVITRLTRYGEGETRSLASFQSYYLNSGYDIYRNPKREEVTYTPSPAVPLDGEVVAGMKDKAPKSKTSTFIGGKSVELTGNGSIYYTLDGSKPTANSTKYSGAITVSDTTKLRAIAVSGNYSDSTVLEYTIKVPQAAKPTAEIVSGQSVGNLVSPGTQIKLTSSNNATIYYTLDGSEPTGASKVYSSPITINANTTIKAMAMGSGVKQSEAAAISYRLGTVFAITASTDGNGSISPSGSSTVLETGSKEYKITPDSGYAINDVLVNGVSVGAVSSYKFSNVARNSSIYASFKPNASIPFKDVSSNQWFYEAVCFAYARELFNGTAADTFSPDSTMTRGMFATVLGRFAGVTNNLSSGIGVVNGTGVNIRREPSIESDKVGFVADKYTAVQVLGQSGEWYKIQYSSAIGYIRNDLIKVYSENYSDLNNSLYYAPFAQWAYLTGVANGAANGSFNGEASITREHMCLMLYNYASVYGKTLPQTVDKVSFTDESSISSNAKSAVYALQQAGVIEGMGDGSFSPQGTATRAQVAQIFKNFVKAIG